MNQMVNSFRFLDPLTSKVLQNWITLEASRPIPWTPLQKPLSACTVALISSGGISMKDDQPFDQEGERQNPWRGDPTFRLIPRNVTAEDIKVWHLHINPIYTEQDINCLLPLERLADLESNGEIGRSAEVHYSFQGYILDPHELLEQSIPAIIQHLRNDAVDAVILVPA